MSRIEIIKLEIERYARDRDWEAHANAVERLIAAVKAESKG